jgi:Tfp pilus assembly protein PilF
MDTDTLKNMLAQGQDSLILRFGLGQALLTQGDTNEAIIHLNKALEFDAEYSAALKLLGKAYAKNNQQNNAINTYTRGIEIAERKGDIQAVKEMKVFLKRLLQAK